MSRSTVYHHQFTTLEGTSLSLSSFAGNVLLMVNTASQCGFTGQYAGLQKLHERLSPRGFTVIGMPCNDFGQQEPACAADIKRFTAQRFHVSFPLTDKVHVKTERRHPFFSQVKNELGIFAVPHWNFYKYVIGRDGRIITWFSPFTGSSSGKLIRAVEQALS